MQWERRASGSCPSTGKVRVRVRVAFRGAGPGGLCGQCPWRAEPRCTFSVGLSHERPLVMAPTAPPGAGEGLPRLGHPASEAVEGARGSLMPHCSLPGSGPAAAAPGLGAPGWRRRPRAEIGAGLTGPRASLSCSCRSCCPRSSTASSAGSGCGGSATCAGRASSAASPSLACPLPASRKCRLPRPGCVLCVSGGGSVAGAGLVCFCKGLAQAPSSPVPL